MDRPYNQFFVKELVEADIRHFQPGPFGCQGGKVYKINLYSTGNFDIFEKILPCSMMRMDRAEIFPVLKFYARQNNEKNEMNRMNPIEMDQYDIYYQNQAPYYNEILDRCTFVPDEFMMRFNTTQTTPLDNHAEILNLIENIFRKNKGNVVLDDFESIKYIIQQQQHISHKQKRNDELEKMNILSSKRYDVLEKMNILFSTHNDELEKMNILFSTRNDELEKMLSLIHI